jgi:hypothetical protein
VTWLQAAFIAGSNLALAAGLMYQRAAILALWKLTRRGFLEALKVDPEAQADAIKAAVDKEREECALIADRHEYGRTRGCLCNACKSGREIRARSGAPAPGVMR